MTVYANAMEISAKAQGCKVIAEFPDTCFTPPQTPATPPGVPIPYPNFGFDSDLTSGSGTVKIGGKEISQENSSHYSKCSGDEAGCAPKKGVVTSKNMGKIYGQKWSMDVKVEGKGVVRFGDISTSNHASDGPDAVPAAFIGKFYINIAGCEKVFAEFKLHRHGDKGSGDDKVCDEGQESEHFVQNEYLQWDRDNNVTATQFESYSVDDAPCICMQAYNDSGGPNPKIDSPHHAKTLACNNAIKKRDTTPTLDQAVDDCCKAVVDNDPRCKTKKKKELVAKCLKAAFMVYLDRAVKKKDKKNSAKKAAQEPIAWEVDPRPGRMWAR